MTDARRDIVRVLLAGTAVEWSTTLGLVFGGCCSNAWALERATAAHPRAGALITFAQFVLVALYGLVRHLEGAAAAAARGVLRVRGAARRRVCVAVEGRGAAARRFADAVGREVRRADAGALVERVSGAREAHAFLEAEAGREKNAASEAVVIVDGDDLLGPELRGRWDYTISLSPSGTRPGASLTVPPRRCLRLKPRAIPLARWAAQVALFLLTSLLNNAAFAYAVPMPVHIIFRSGGLVVNMLIGFLVGGRRYTPAQILSVVLVTLGVACTTLSAARPAAPHGDAAGPYFTGILLLTLALVLSGLMGLAQDRAYERYGRGHWQEALFYLHALALPGFALVWRSLAAQARAVSAGPRVALAPGVAVPVFYAPLGLSVVTQLVCVAGVHRLTSRVGSLTVTLVLVVRKAVSLGISVLLLGGAQGAGGWLWGGAGLVLLGTVGYAVGGAPRPAKAAEKEQ